jgi:hypothetical protein
MYNICLVAPDQSTMIFAEVALLLRGAFASLCLDCSFGLNSLVPGRSNIVLAANLLRYNPRMAEFRLIPFQMEQLHAKEGWYDQGLEELLRNASQVWDYSQENIAFLAQRGIAAKHLPLGYHQCLERIGDEAEKDIDVLFYGLLNQRREKILNQLVKAGVRVECLTGKFAEERDAYIARSHLVLNIHYYPMKILEVVRVSYLLNNGRLVISEESEIDPFQAVGLCTAPYDKLLSTCVEMLEQPEKMRALRETNYQLFKRHFPMSDFLQRVL